MWPTGFRFADPWALVLVLAVPLGWWLVRRHGDRPDATLRLPTLKPLAGAPRSRRQRLLWVPPTLHAVAVILLLGALARPQVGEATSRVPARGIDIVIALDISGSMEDPGLSAPSKLAGAKAVITQFLTQRVTDRVGFVVFESEARVISPLTTDYTALAQLVAQVDNGLLPDGTAIGVGIATAINVLRSSQAKSKVIILATDGENNVDTIPPETAAQLARTLHIKLYTIGMFAADETPQTTEIDERGMSAWARATGGFYGRAQSGADLQRIFQTISQLERSRFDQTHYTVYDDRADWLVVPGLLALALEVTLTATLLRRAP
jgi:Ca-activated chloride channel family protein